MFDLFRLHSEKDKPKGWIWVYFKSDLLKKEYLRLLNKKSQNQTALEISKCLRCGLSTLEKHLIKLKNSKEIVDLPLPLIIQLTKLINKKGFKKELIKNMNYFVFKNSPIKQKTKAVRKLNIKIAKMIGAHVADGYMCNNKAKSRLTICDGKEDIIKKFSGWLKETFQVNSITKLNKKDNAWNCYVNNKIIVRYFNNIFQIPDGKKSYIIKEPKIIKKSNLEIRNAFLAGMLNFDGGVKTSGMVALTTMSQDLIKDIKEIFDLNGVKTKVTHNKLKGSWAIETSSSRNKEKQEKLLKFFEEGTWKYNRLKFFIEKNQKYSIEQLNELFPKHYLAKISLNKVYNSIKRLGSGKINDISKEFKVANTTLYKYLFILEKANLIYKTGEKMTNGKDYWIETVYNLK